MRLTPSGTMGLFLKLLENKIGGRFYDSMIKDLYTNTRCAVKVSDHRTSFFPYRKGVCQGCVLSPLLFNLYINELPLLFEKITSNPFILPNSTAISSLLYADDLVQPTTERKSNACYAQNI